MNEVVRDLGVLLRDPEMAEAAEQEMRRMRNRERAWRQLHGLGHPPPPRRDVLWCGHPVSAAVVLDGVECCGLCSGAGPIA